MKRRLKAFTIMEVAIAMAISAISVSLMYNGKLFFERLLIKHEKLELEILTLNRLDQNLRHDFFLSRNVVFTNEGLAFVFPDPKKNVAYITKPEMILKETNFGVDTFLLIGGFEKKQVFKPFAIKVSLNIQVHDQVNTLYYHKRYSPFIIQNLIHNLYGD